MPTTTIAFEPANIVTGETGVAIKYPNLGDVSAINFTRVTNTTRAAVNNKRVFLDVILPPATKVVGIRTSYRCSHATSQINLIEIGEVLEPGVATGPVVRDRDATILNSTAFATHARTLPTPFRVANNSTERACEMRIAFKLNLAAADFIEFSGVSLEIEPSEQLNVMAYGALGDGRANDGPAIQAAIDALPSTGGIVFFPPGTYVIKAPIKVEKAAPTNRDGVYLVGAGPRSTVIRNANAVGQAAIEVTGADLGNANRFGAVQHMKITGVSRDGVGIKLALVADYLFENIQIERTGSHGVEITNQCITLTFDRVHITGMRDARNAFHIGASSQCNALRFRDCRVGNSTKIGAGEPPAVTGSFGLYSAPLMGGVHTDWVITGCTFESSQFGIWLNSVYVVTITGTYFENNGTFSPGTNEGGDIRLGTRLDPNSGVRAVVVEGCIANGYHLKGNYFVSLQRGARIAITGVRSAGHPTFAVEESPEESGDSATVQSCQIDDDKPFSGGWAQLPSPMERLNVKTWGAKGDGKALSGLGMAVGSTILTATAGPFSNTSLDAGKTILVRDAGPGVPPTDLLTTIVSITDSNTAILATAASSLVTAGTGAGYFGTDDWSAIQTVIGQATHGGQLLFPAGTYVIASPLVFGDGAHPFDAVIVQGSGNSDARTKGTLILWLGHTPTSSILKLRACQFCEFRDFAILAGTTAAIGMEVTTAGALAAFRNRVSNVTISGADQRPAHHYDVRLGTALRVGPEVGGQQVDQSVYELLSLVHCQIGLVQFGTQVPNNSYRDIVFQNCTIIGADFQGSDVKMENCSFAPYAPPRGIIPRPPNPIADVRVQSTAGWAFFRDNYHEAEQTDPLNPLQGLTGPCYLFPNALSRSTPTTMINCRVQWNQTSDGNVIDFQHTGALSMLGCVFMGFNATSHGKVNINVPAGGSSASMLSLGCAYANGVSPVWTGNVYLLDMDNAAGNGYNSSGNLRLFQNALFLDGGGIVWRKADGTGGGRQKLTADGVNWQMLSSTNEALATLVLADPGRGRFATIGDGEFAGGYRQTIDGWYRDDVAVALRSVQLSRLAVGAAVPAMWVAPRSGSLTGVCVTSTEAPTAGNRALKVEVIKFPGGIGSNLVAELDGNNPTTFRATTQAKDVFTFNAGELLAVILTTSPYGTFDQNWTPLTADIRVSIEVET